MINFLGPKGSLKTQAFKKSQTSQGRNRFRPIFSSYSRLLKFTVPQGTNCKTQAFGSKRHSFGNYCGSYNITSVTPKRLLETQIFV